MADLSVLVDDATIQQTAPITVIPDEKFGRIERFATLFITIVPFVALFGAIAVFWNRGIGKLDLSIFLVMYIISGLGVTVGFHRYFTHRSFHAKQSVRAALAIAGSLSVEGSVIKWVADHRRHHAFADQPGDPHSPHLEEAEGIKGVISGLWHAHIGWFFDLEATNVPRFAPDLLKDKLIRKIDSLTPVWIVASFILPAVIGFAVTHTLAGTLTAFLWGGLVRMFFLHHVTWSINSICHYYGKRPFESSDLSTNNKVLSFISFGEAWHNNHHAFPSSAIHGLERWQLDPGWWLIHLLERTGLVYDVKRPSEADMARKRMVQAR